MPVRSRRGAALPLRVVLLEAKPNDLELKFASSTTFARAVACDPDGEL